MIAGLYCWDHSELKQTFSLIQYGFLMLFAFILWYLNWNFPTNIQKSLFGRLFMFLSYHSSVYWIIAMKWITWGDGKKRIHPQLLHFILETQKSIRLLESMISCYLSFGFYLSDIMHQCLICITSYSTIWWKSSLLENQHRKYNFWKEKPVVLFCLFVLIES